MLLGVYIFYFSCMFSFILEINCVKFSFFACNSLASSFIDVIDCLRFLFCSKNSETLLYVLVISFCFSCSPFLLGDESLSALCSVKEKQMVIT